MSTALNTKINNCKVSGMKNGNSGGGGIYLEGSNYSLISNVALTDNNYGLGIAESIYVNVTNSQFNNNVLVGGVARPRKARV